MDSVRSILIALAGLIAYFFTPGIADARLAGERATPNAMAGLYNEANRALEENRPEEAIELYNSIDIVNFDLEYNRGLAYARAGDFGRASLHFHRALRIDRTEASARRALALIDQSARTRSDFGSALNAVRSRVSIDQAALGALTLYLIAIVFLAGALGARYFNHRLYRTALLGFKSIAPIAALGLLWGVIDIYLFETQESVVVIVDEAPARVEAIMEAPIQFSAPAGSSFEVLERANGFLKVRARNGLAGWIHTRETLAIKKS